MKLGINLLCLTDLVTEAHLPAIRQIQAAGYDGVEIPVLSGDPDHYARLGRYGVRQQYRVRKRCLEDTARRYRTDRGRPPPHAGPYLAE